MSNRGWTQLRTLGTNRRVVRGAFQPNGAGAGTKASPGVLNVKGHGYSVMHTAGTSKYVITFDDKFNDFDGFDCKVHSATLGLGAQVIATPDVTNGQTLTIQLYDTSTKATTNQTDLAFDANTWVSFDIQLKDTTSTY